MTDVHGFAEPADPAPAGPAASSTSSSVGACAPHGFELFVRDGGIGITPEYHDRIWGLFQTLERRDKIESTGIGLSVVRKIVESNGGRTWVESQPGAGATFHFTWGAEAVRAPAEAE
jgi:signal transduction histidine kinase